MVFSKLGFEGHDRTSVDVCLRGCPAGMLKHVRNKRNVCITEVGVFFFAVVGLVRQTEATLEHVDQISLRVAWVVVHIHAEDAADAVARELTEEVAKLVEVRVADAFEVHLDRCRTKLVNAGFV